jgi:ABC-2 type transport system permease protein
MTPVQAMIAKELKSYFVSPIFYVVAVVFLLSVGILSFVLTQIAAVLAIQQMQMQGSGGAQLNLNDIIFRPLFFWTGFIIFLVLLPLLTMRLFAEERKQRTFEFLMTSPIRINEIVAGKFLSVCLVFFGVLGMTGLVPFILGTFSDFDWNPVMTGYLGLALMGALFLSVGAFASATTENQIVAALLAFGTMFFLWLIGLVGQRLENTWPGDLMTYLSWSIHFEHLLRGLIDTKDLVYFVSGIVLMLFLAHRVLDSVRWK